MKLTALVLIFATFGTAMAAEYHVAPAGNDAHPGTAAQPFATLEKARDAIRGQGGGDVIIHGGTYTLDKTFVLTPEDSGTTGKPVRYMAAKGEIPVITSARQISGWKLADAATPNLAVSAKGKVWVADVAKGWRFHFLYVDGRPQPVARMNKTNNWHAWPKVPKVGTIEPAGQLLTFAPGLLEGLPDNGDLEMILMPVVYWNSISVLRDFNVADSTCRRHSKNPTVFRRNLFRQGNFNLLNGLKFLTRAGEWCVDSAAGKLYWWPESGEPGGKDVYAPTLYRLVETRGTDAARVHDIEIRGLTFTCTDRLPEDQWPEHWTKRQAELPDAMIYLEGVENVTLADNVISWSGSYGVALEKYAQQVRVIRNEIAHPGCGGVQLQGYGPGTTDVNKNNIIRRNYIHHTGQGGYLHSAAVTIYQSGGNDISLNLIDHMPYAAVMIAGAAWNEFGTGKPAGAWDSYGNLEAMYKVRWDELPGGRAGTFTRQSFKRFLHSRNNRICDNIITNYMEALSDGGALDSWSCGLDNIWEGNLLRRDKIRTDETICIALYMDDYVDRAVVRNNICWHSMAHGGKIRYKDADIANYTIRWKHGQPVLNKGDNRWENNTVSHTKPTGYDARLKELADQAAKEGGWLNRPQEDQP